jgi:hypothetical protein
VYSGPAVASLLPT